MTAYVKLTVAEPLDKQQYVKWFHTVEQVLPSGLIAQTQLTPNNTSRFYHKVTAGGQHCYVVPLVRNLDASEIYHVVQEWNKAYPTGDFVIDHSQPIAIQEPQDLQQKKIHSVLQSWGKQQHQRWMSDLQNQGWRYGVKVSVKDKTHPWLQPWESLPPPAQKQNIQAAKDLLKLLNDFGYTIVQQTVA